MHTDFSIDYADVLLDDLPYAWHERYQLMCTGATNVLRISVHGFEYLFDFCSDIGVADREDRVVAAFGVSRSAENPRDESRMRGFPSDSERGDRGHLIAHGSGGGVDINLVHQDTPLNRGWSPQGKRYREMERYTAAYAGTFFFSRPIYDDETGRPARFEIGILRPDRTMWVELFEN